MTDESKNAAQRAIVRNAAYEVCSLWWCVEAGVIAPAKVDAVASIIAKHVEFLNRLEVAR